MSESPVTSEEPTALFQFEEDPGSLHVHDLPQLYQKPSASALLDTLKLLSHEALSFSTSSKTRPQKVDEQGVPRYLTTIVSSSLNWIEDDDAKESIWDAASARLSERSGRTAMPAMTRTFVVNEELAISLHEPSLTEDNLGLKTWTSSLLLAQRLAECRKHIPSDCSRVLELGSGTGLVGIAAACIWNAQVLLTDLPEIVPNLLQNLALNRDVIEKHRGQVSARTLDWADPTDLPRNAEGRYMVILAADPIYSPEHPKMLVSTVSRWICPDPNARFIVELPLRDRYEYEREDLRQTLRSFHFDLVVEGTDTGHDDWHDRDGNQAVVKCWWSVWKPSDSI